MSERTPAQPTKKAAWWSPQGWSWLSEPTPFQRTRGNGIDDWGEALKAEGYGNEFSFNEPDSGTSIYWPTVWRHADEEGTAPHLFVELWDAYGSPAQMFVAEKDIAAFWFDKLPEIQRNRTSLEEPSLFKAVVAFIRHGHGEHTIDEFGLENREERKRRNEAWEASRRRRDEAKRTPGGSQA